MACQNFSCRLLKNGLFLLRFAQFLNATVLMGIVTTAAHAQNVVDSTPRTPHQINQEHTLYYGVHLPRERKVTRALNLAEELIAERRYAEGIAILVQVLSRETDAITDTSAGADLEPIAVSQRIEQIIESLSSAGRRAYKLEVEAQANRLFAAALGPPIKRKTVVDLLSRFPSTDAATKAMWQLSRYHLDRDEPELAAAYLRRLRDSHIGRYEPQRTLVEAVCSLMLGDTQAARSTIGDLANQGSQEAIIIAGRSYRSMDVESIFAAIAGATLTDKRLEKWSSLAWLGRDGNYRRTANQQRVFNRNERQIHLWPTWSARGSVDPDFHGAVNLQQQFRGSKGRPSLFVGSALGVEQQVIFRTPDQLIGIDWETGKRAWTSRLQDNGKNNTTTSEEVAAVNHRLRLWYDQPLAGLSSDGNHVFMIQPGWEQSPKKQAERVRFGGFPRRREAGESASWNTLTAYDLSSQGKLKWTTARNPRAVRQSELKKDANRASSTPPLPLSEAYFTEAPLWAEGGLYIVAEIDQTLQFCELQPDTGKLLWSQPLASVNRSIRADTRRRLAGTMTAVAQGVAVCSTGAGLVVGVDLTNRTLKWFYRFPINEGYRPPRSSPWRSTNDENWSSKLGQSWLENQVRIVGSRVVVASPESDQLHCVELLTGDALWTAKGKPEDILLSAATAEGIVLSGSTEVRGVDLETGAATWRYALPVDTPASHTTLSGRGIVLGHNYLLPLTTNSDRHEAALLEIATGNLQRTITSHGGKLGNLIRYDQAIVSQTEYGVQRFDELDQLVADSSDNPPDTLKQHEWLCRQGEIALDRGDTQLAYEQLQQAYRLAPDSLLVQSRLRTVSLALPFQSLDESQRGLLLELVESAPRRLKLMLQRMDFLVSEEQAKPIQRLAAAVHEELSRQDALLKRADGYFVRSSRWLGALLEQAAQSDSKALANSVEKFRESIRQAAIASPDTKKLELYSDLFPIDLAASKELQQRFKRRHSAAAAIVAARLTAPSAETVATDHRQESSWSTRQIEVTTSTNATETSRRSSRQSLARSVAVIEPEGPKAKVEVTLQRDGQAMQLRDRHGELINRIALERYGVEFARRMLKKQSVAAWHQGDHLFIGFDGKILAYNISPEPSDANRLVWKQAPDGNPDLSSRTLGGDVALFSEEGGGTLSVADEEAMFARCALLLATPHVLIAKTPSRVLGISPENGNLLWSRKLMLGRLAPVADGNRLYAVDNKQTGMVLSLHDGSLIDDWQPLEAPAGSVIAARGTTALTQQRRGLITTLQLIHLESGSVLHEQDFESVPEFLVVDDRVLVCSIDGKLQSYHLGEARLEYERQVAIPSSTINLALSASRERLFLACNERTSKQHRGDGIYQMDEVVPLTGALFAFDLETGEETWPRPLELEGQAILARQPEACPLLVLGARRDQLAASSGGRALQLAFVDLASGRLVHSMVAPNESASGVHRISCQAGPSPEVRFDLPQTTVILRATSSPARPKPTYDAAFDTTTRKEDSGLLGVGQQIRQLINGGLQKNASPREKAKPGKTDND